MVMLDGLFFGGKQACTMASTLCQYFYILCILVILVKLICFLDLYKTNCTSFDYF